MRRKRHAVHHRLAALAMLFACCAASAAEPSRGTPMAEEAVRESFEGADGKLPAGWRVVSGSWRTEGGALVADCLRGEGQIVVGEPTWQNYEVEVRAAFLRVREPTRWLSIVVRAASDCAPPWSHFPIRQATDRKNGMEFAVRVSRRRWAVPVRVKGKAATALGETRRLRVVVRGDEATCFLDGEQVVRTPFCVARSHGSVGLAVSGCVARFDDFVVRRLPDTPVQTVSPERAKACQCVAHRGFSAVAPENTLAAVRKAMAAGAEGCEFDVYASRDGVAVLMHDETVDRTTNGKGKVSHLTAAELGKLDAGSWKGKQYAGEPVPTLLAVLRAMKGKGCTAVIEVKADGIAGPVVAAVRAADMVESSAIISFKDQAIADARAIEPRLPGALIVGGKQKGTASAWAKRLAGRAKKCGAHILDLSYGMLSPTLVAELHRRGYKVWCWTVDDPLIMTALIRWGVDGITTNRPNVLIALRKKLGAK